MRDDDARAVVERAARKLGLDLGANALDLVQAVARFETSYGEGWATSCPAAVGSNNWGAVHATALQPSIECTDHREDGTPYQARFRVYATPEDGAADVIAILWRMPHVRAFLLGDEADPEGMARAMRADRYYEAPVRTYTAGLRRNWSAIRTSLGRTGPSVIAIVASVTACAASIALAVKLSRT